MIVPPPRGDTLPRKDRNSMDETAERLEKRIDRVDDRTHADYRQLVKDISELKTAVRVLGVKLDERSAPRGACDA